ncbi:TIGR03089 family protein [Streptomyces diastatochromogenes]|nr:TIGR03089 family protein [Streptomyces diastatochromogenes]
MVTFYDDATGERVELSVATFANWVAKTANLLQGELSAAPGDRLALLLPAHWQSAVWLLACASVGVTAEIGGDPPTRTSWSRAPTPWRRVSPAPGADRALLAPLGRRFPAAPAGYADYAVEVPSQGDRFAPSYRSIRRLRRSSSTVRNAAPPSSSSRPARTRPPSASPRLPPPLRPRLRRLAGPLLRPVRPLAAGGSVVLCRNPDQLGAEGLEKRIESERVTHTAL